MKRVKEISVKYVKLISIVVSLFGILIPFQNCSNINFEALSDSNLLITNNSSLSSSDSGPSKIELGELESRKETVLNLIDPKSNLVIQSRKVAYYDIMIAMAKSGCLNPAWGDFLAANLLNTKLGDPRSLDPKTLLGNTTLLSPKVVSIDDLAEMFTLPPLVRILYKYKQCLTPKNLSDIEFNISTFPNPVLGHGTLNHAAMQATSYYLLAQFFPNAMWNDLGTKKIYTSAEVMKLIKANLLSRTWRFFQSGQAELYSPTYSIVDIFPLLNLYDFATDEEIRNRANAELTLNVVALKANSFHGTILSPITRHNYDQRNAPDSPQDYVPSVAQHVLWFYYGDLVQSNYDLRSGKEPIYVSMLALSSWRPPDVSYSMNKKYQAGFDLKTLTPEFAIWGAKSEVEIVGSSYISNDFAIGTGNVVFNPEAYNSRKTFSILFKSEFAHNQIECLQPYLQSNLGEDAWSSDRWSPFQQIYHFNKKEAVILYDIPKQDPWVFVGNRYFDGGSDVSAAAYARHYNKDNLFQMFQCRIPKAVDEIVKEQKWIFARKGNVYIAIATLNGVNQYPTLAELDSKYAAKLDSKYHIVKVREAKSALYFKISRASDEVDFKSFQEKTKLKVPTFSISNIVSFTTNNSASVSFIEEDGKKTEVTFLLEKAQKTDGSLRTGYYQAFPKVIHGDVEVKPVLNPAETLVTPFIKFGNGQLNINDTFRNFNISVLSN